MFRALKRILAEPLGNAKKRSKFLVTKKSEIVALLSQAHKKKAFLTLQPGSQDQFFTTAILGVYPDHGLMVLDELSPAVGHKQFLQEKQAKVTGRIDGVELRFETHLVGEGSKSGIAFYKVAMPTALYFRQQRQTYRVSLKGVGVPFYSLGGATPSIRGTLRDLSLGGVGVMTDCNVSLSRGDTLELCAITLPDKGDIKFTLIIDSVHDNVRGGGMSFGGHFCKLSAADRNKMRKYIAEAQRKYAKRSR
ncbi:MAG: flagellar brake protein [Candidatus Polarisedimenticolaceae bacterium]|nr:flagellar brake protein [Candidatus Polarisedimenticolaceae bacterium]